MMIESVIKNNKEIIENSIKNMKCEGCVKSFTNYINLFYEGKITDEFEKGYVNKLDSSLNDFAVSLEMKGMDKLSKGELIESIENFYYEGFYGYNDRDDALEQIGYYSDADIYEDIKRYMTDIFNEYVSELTTTSKEKKIKQLKDTINNRELRIKNYKDDIKKMTDEIEKVEKELKELEEE